jgi:hypothetical protein
MEPLAPVLRSRGPSRGSSLNRWSVRSGLALTLLVGLSSPAAACPSCSLGQALSTLVYVAAFMAIPYVIVTGVCMWMRRVVRTEEDSDSTPPL